MLNMPFLELGDEARCRIAASLRGRRAEDLPWSNAGRAYFAALARWRAKVTIISVVLISFATVRRTVSVLIARRLGAGTATSGMRLPPTGFATTLGAKSDLTRGGSASSSLLLSFSLAKPWRGVISGCLLSRGRKRESLEKLPGLGVR